MKKSDLEKFQELVANIKELVYGEKIVKSKRKSRSKKKGKVNARRVSRSKRKS